VFWDVTPCGSCKNKRIGINYRLHHQGKKNQQARNNVSKQTIHSYETSVITRVRRRHIPGDGTLHSQRRENFKSYTFFTDSHNKLLIFIQLDAD
jgi:hypothetical protein